MVRAFPAEFLNTIVRNNEHMFKNMNILVTPTFHTLRFLGRHYRESYYVRELAKILTISIGSASGQLRELRNRAL